MDGGGNPAGKKGGCCINNYSAERGELLLPEQLASCVEQRVRRCLSRGSIDGLRYNVVASGSSVECGGDLLSRHQILKVTGVSSNASEGDGNDGGGGEHCRVQG